MEICSRTGNQRTLSILTLKAPIATKVVCFSRCWNVKEASMTNSVDPDQTALLGAVWFGSTLFASLLKFVCCVRQLFPADDFSRRHFSDAFFLGALRANSLYNSIILFKVSCICKKNQFRLNLISLQQKFNLTSNYKGHGDKLLF